MQSSRRFLVAALTPIVALAIAACGALPEQKPPEPAPPVVAPTVPPPAPVVPPSPPAPQPPAPEPVAPAPVQTPPVAATAPAILVPVAWSDLPGWRADDVAQAWGAFLAGCTTLRNRAQWQPSCAAAAALPHPGRDAVRAFFETHFVPHQVRNGDNTDTGLVTGYYEPLLNGARKQDARFRFPLYGVPDDLLVIDLAELHPELKGMRLRGRMEGRRIVPYFSRSQIEKGDAALRGREILWVDDPVDLFFLQIQGSGRVRLANGETVAVGYGDQNGHPYRSIGRLLVDRGDLPLERASMQGIKQWAKENPSRLLELLNHNASYVFFREMPPGLPGPLGTLGIPLTAGRSIAVDQRHVPLGAPVFLATTWPNTTRPLNRLVMAQDTGGAIRGAVRADFFWGFGEQAAREAGRMRQQGRMWVLLPKPS